MARQYQIGPQVSGDIILTDPQNDEINQSVSELNGGLDQNNMPLDSVSRTKFIAPTYVNQSTAPAWEEYHYQSQDLYIAEKCDSVVSLPVGTWSMGWNKFEASANASDRTGFVLDINAKEGMLKGEAIIDFEHRQSYFLYHIQLDGVASYGSLIKDKHTGELGVFVNDVLVGRTGPLWIACGRHTYTIPWATPVKSGPCHIDVRWLIDYKNVKKNYSVTGVYETGLNQTYPVQVASRILWCRNQYR
jgi:hypothetical protein